MKRLIAVAAVVTSLVGCVRPSRTVVPPEYEPLDIAVLAPSGGFGFWVNQPAYVALFDITPGVGVRMLYPYTSKQLTETVQVGSSYGYAAFSFRPRAYFAGRAVNEPHMLLAVASRKPLNVSHTVGYSDWLTYKMGFSSFAGTSLEVVNRLFSEVLPPQPDGDWATAVYLVYPNVPWRENMYRLVRCPDGLVYVVNIETPVFTCPAPIAPEPKTVDQDRERRQPGMVKVNSAVARASRAGELPVLRAMGDVVTRPPAPVAPRTFWGTQSSNGSSADRDYARRSAPTVQTNQNIGPAPVVSRPQVETPPPPPPQGNDPRGEPARRENPTKEP